VTPAMALNATDYIWSIGELLDDALVNAPIDRYRKRRFKVIEGGRTD
jgi:hypothetical protein